MRDRREDLQSTEESIERDAERVRALEDEKKARDPSDPRVVDLSEQIDEMTRRLKDKTAAELNLSKEIQARE